MKAAAVKQLIEQPVAEELPGEILTPIKRDPTVRRILTFDIETKNGRWRSLRGEGDDKVRFRPMVAYAVGFSYRLQKDWRVGSITGEGEEATVLFKGEGRKVIVDFLKYALTSQFSNEWIWAHNLRGFDGRYLIDAMEDPWFTANFRAKFIETRAGVIAIDIEPLPEKKHLYQPQVGKKKKRIYWRFCDSLQVVRLALGSKGERGMRSGSKRWRPGFAATFGGLADAVTQHLKDARNDAERAVKMAKFKHEQVIRWCWATVAEKKGEISVDHSTVKKYVSDGDKTAMDHTLADEDPRWPEYLANDCATLRWGIEGLQRLVNDIGGQLDITIAAMSMYWFRAQHYHPGAEGGHRHKWINQNLQHESFFRRAVSGGRTEIFRMKGSDLVYIDFNSLYPAIANSEPMPVGKAFESTGIETHDDVFRYLAAHPTLIGFVHCDVFVPDDVPIPPLGVKHEIAGVTKYIFATGNLRGTWSTHELALLDEVGGRITRIHKALFQETAISFNDYVEACYELRKRGKREGRPGLDQLGKSFGNNFVGKFSMRRERTSCFMDPTLSLSEQTMQLQRFRAAIDLGMRPDISRSAWEGFEQRSEHVERCHPCFESAAAVNFKLGIHEDRHLDSYRARLLTWARKGGPKPEKTAHVGRDRGALVGRFIFDCWSCIEKLKNGAEPPRILTTDVVQAAECRRCYGTGAWRNPCPKCSDTGLWLNLTHFVDRPSGASFFKKQSEAGNAQYVIPAVNATVTSIARVRWWRTAMAVMRADAVDNAGKTAAVKKAGGFIAYGDTDSHIVGGITIERMRDVLPIYRYDEAPQVWVEAGRLGMSRLELLAKLPHLEEQIARLSPIGAELGQVKVEHTLAEFDALRPKLYGFTCKPDCPCGEPGTNAATKGFGKGFAGSGDWKKDAVENYAGLHEQGSFVVAHQFVSWKLAFDREIYDPGIIETKRSLQGVYDKRRIADDGVLTTPLRIDMWSLPLDGEDPELHVESDDEINGGLA